MEQQQHNQADINYNKALQLFNAGQLDAAQGIYESILNDTPDHGPTHHAFGILLSRKGLQDQALEHLQRATKHLPESANLHADLGAVCFRQSNLEQAEHHFLRAIILDPKNAVALNSLGVIAMQSTNLPKAEEFFRRATQENPDYPEAWENLGFSLIYQQNKLEEAVAVIRKAMDMNPQKVDLRIRLGMLFIDLGRIPEAEQTFRQALSLNSNAPMALIGLAIALMNQNKMEEAKDKLVRALDIDPANEIGYYNMVALLDLIHSRDEAAAIVEKAKQHLKNESLLNLMEAHLAKRDGRVDDAIALLEKTDGVAGQAIDKAYALGHLHNKKQKYAEAFKWFEEANTLHDKSLQAAAIDRDLYPTILKGIAEHYAQNTDNILPQTVPYDSPTPIFLVGFPRSGTTLTGQILHSHPDVYVADEVMAIDHARTTMPQFGLQRYPHDLNMLTPEQIKQLRSLFFDAHRTSPLYEDKPVLIDKFPFNMVHTGLIHTLFPDAKIIFVERHPCDCVLSCFMQHFRLNPALVHFLDLQKAAELYALAMDAWNIQKEKLPLNIHTIRYEDLTADFENQTRKLLEFSDLPWHDDVMQFHKKAAQENRTITPSYAQITEKIHTGAAYRWQKYKEQMKDVLPILLPYAEKAGYTAD